jgi:GNAT superfamily N-acetyltransferase
VPKCATVRHGHGVTCLGRSIRDVTDLPQVRRLSLADLSLLRQIDRSEHNHLQYSVADGRLVSRPFDFRVPAWDPVGNGAHSVAAKIEFAEPIVRRGADFLGVFVAEEPAGLAIVESALAPGTAWLALLHVDRRHRRRGVASLLWGAAVDRARANAANAIYVSATPSDSAVGFYLSRGCRLATRSEINDHLYELEPDDVHLICDL